MKAKNILFLFAETWGGQTIGALGHPDVKTPTIDWLVNNGRCFNRCYVQGSLTPAVCIPSRAQMLTGRGVFSLDGRGEYIAEHLTTLPEMLKECGYTTYISGKWHNNPSSMIRGFTDGGNLFGLNGAEGWYQQCNGHWHIPYRQFSSQGRYTRSNMQYADPPIRPFSPPFTAYRQDGVHSSEVFVDPAIDFLDQYKDEKPLFMYLPFLAAHDPYQAPQEFADLYDENALTLPPNFMPKHPFNNGDLNSRDEKLLDFPRNEAAIRGFLKSYYALVSHLDAQIRRVLDKLKSTGMLDQTIIIFSADHGIANGQHGLLGKQNLYDHSVRVPMIIKGQGILPGSVSEISCYLYDLLSTVAEIAGADSPKSNLGQSFSSQLFGAETNGRDHLYLAYRDVQRAVRRGQYKYIEYRVDGKRTSQLFDLDSDPWETNDLIFDENLAPLVSDLQQCLYQYESEERAANNEFGLGFW